MRNQLASWSCGFGIGIIVIALIVAEIGGVSTALINATPMASPAATPAESPVAEAEGPTTQIIVGEVTIEMTNDGFRPAYFESAVGRDITVTVVNSDDERHNFTIEELDIDVDLAPGESTTLEIEQPQIGRYRYFSDLPGDEEMEGAFSVFI